MSEPDPSPVTARISAAGEWMLTLGLPGALGWTTLCLGGYRPETMVFTSWTVFGLAALGAVLWSARSVPGFNLAGLLPVPFLLFALASTCWLAPAHWLAWREWLLWLQAWLVFLLVLHHGRGRAQSWVLVAIMAGLGLAGAGLAAWQRFHDPGWLMLGRRQAEQFFGRSAGMFGSPNSLAGFLELLIPVCLTLLWSRATSLLVKVLCGWLAAVFLGAVVLTGSRGGWIALALTLLLWPLLFTRGWRTKLIGLVAVVVLATAAVLALFHFSEQARARIRPFLTGEFESSRPIIWRAGLEIWQGRPWLGTGAASYNVLFDQHRPRGFLNEPQWTHNDYLNTLGDYGVVGFAAWAAAGGGLLWLGWRATRRLRREKTSAGRVFDLWRWRQGLWLGLVAFSLHLLVDFHTKIPALAFAAAVAAGLMLRDEPGLVRGLSGWWRPVGLVSAAALLALAAGIASPLYRGEALRYAWRQKLDKGGPSTWDTLVPAALASFQESVRIDPGNGQAWADLSWATTLSWHVTHGDLAATGRRAEAAAEKALGLCPVVAEFWVRKGIAQDMEGRHGDAEICFRRALSLAPNLAEWHYAFAYHLSVLSERKPEALAELDTCLTLDPGNSAAVSLRDRLKASR
jgi:O-antigen ligase